MFAVIVVQQKIRFQPPLADAHLSACNKIISFVSYLIRLYIEMFFFLDWSHFPADHQLTQHT